MPQVDTAPLRGDDPNQQPCERAKQGTEEGPCAVRWGAEVTPQPLGVLEGSSHCSVRAFASLSQTPFLTNRRSFAFPVADQLLLSEPPPALAAPDGPSDPPAL